MTEYAISYGKAEVPVYGRGAAGRDNALLAAHVTVEVLGDNFLPAYTEGDTLMVVATDSMKNLILRETGTWTGATLESLLHHLGGRLLADYAQMAAVRVSAEEIRFDPPGRAGRCTRTPGDATTALLEPGPRRRRRCHRGAATARRGIEPPEADRQRLHRVRARRLHNAARAPRPALWVGIDVSWRYRDPQHALGGGDGDLRRRRAVRDICAAVFEDSVSESIQHLVHAMGARPLEFAARAGRGLVRGAQPHARPGGRGGRRHRPLSPRTAMITPTMRRVSGRPPRTCSTPPPGASAAGVPVTLSREGAEVARR